MIGVENQFFLSFSINGAADFMQTPDFVFFRITEEAGNTLPQFMLKFRLTANTSQYILQLNETSTLVASYGDTMNNMVTSGLYITETTMVPSGAAWVIVVEGHLNAPGYLYNRHTGCSPKESGVKCVLNTAKKYFNIQSNIQDSTDNQNWVQHNISDKQFVRNTWLHSNAPASFISVGISAVDNTFVLKDMGAAYAAEVDWYFQQDADGTVPNKIPFLGQPKIRNISGFINSWLGYPTKLNVFDMDTGLNSLVDTATNIFSSSSGGPLANSGITSRLGQYLTHTSNMHQNYHQARQNNLYGNAVASSFQVTLVFEKMFRPIMVLDRAYFSLGTDVGDIVSEYSLGNYTVFKVVHLFGDMTTRTVVGLCRESPGASGNGG